MNTIKLNTIGERPVKKGGASGGGGGNYVYIDTSSITEFGYETDALYGHAYLIKDQMSNGNIVVIPCWWFMGFYPPLAVCIDLNLKMTPWDESEDKLLPEMTTLGEDIAKYHPWILDLPRLTEEEFYKIPSRFTFILNGEPKRYNYKEGMTWGEWIDSPYNDGNFSVHDANMGEGIQEYVHYEYSAITNNEYYYVKPTDLIQPNMNYVVNNQVG